MTIRARLLMNVVVVLIAMLIVGAVAILGTRFIKKNINELTQKSTPYQIKALNQQRALQAHATNLLGISSSKNIGEFSKISPSVSDSLAQVSKASEDMAKLKGELFYSEDKSIAEITASILDTTSQKIKAHDAAVVAAQSVKGRLSDASKKMAELDASIRKLQQSTSGTMIKSVDSFVAQTMQVNNLTAARDGLKDLAFYVSKIPVTEDKRSVAGLRDNTKKTITNIINALQETKGIEKAVNEVVQRLKVLNEKVAGGDGLASLQFRYISDEDESLKSKIDDLAKEAGYEITYVMPTVEREINAAKTSLKANTGGMSTNISAFTDTDAVLAAASTLSLLNASIQTQVNNCIYARNINDFNNEVSRIGGVFGQADSTARRLKELLGKGDRGDELKTLTSVTNALAAVKQEFGGVADKTRASIKSTETLDSLNGKMKEIVAAQLSQSKAEVESAGSNQEAAVVSVNKVANRTMVMVMVVGLAAIVVTLVLGVLIGRAIARPLNNLVESVQSVENQGCFAIDLDLTSEDEIGKTVKAFSSLMTTLDSTVSNINSVMDALAHSDLSSRVQVDAKGDLSKLKDNINASVERLAGTMSIIRDNTGHVAAAAGQVKGALNQVSEGSQSQLDSIRRLASAIHESSISIAEVAKNTENASAYSKETAQLVRNGQEKMRQMVDAVEKIAKNSERISTITDVIGQIADQTHLLSLNATIEAARAGEHGKGFAVVADEVRNLAEDVARSVDEITVLIQQAVKEAEIGVHMAGDVNSEMDGVVNASLEVDGMLYTVAQAMEEQNATLQEINENVSLLNSTAESNAKAAEEISTSIEELSGLAEETRRQVEQFKV